MPENTRANLNKLLQERNEHPNKQEVIDEKIKSVFCQTHALLVLDMSGFSRMTIRYGIIHFLAMIHGMCEVVVPVIEEYGGRVIKQEADNIFAVFPNVQSSIAAATDFLKRTSTVNTMLPDEADIYLSLGIGYGEVLMIEDDDMFGSELNLTSKLGEDLARSGEILLTESAFEQLSTKEEWEKIDFSISGLDLVAYKASIDVRENR